MRTLFRSGLSVSQIAKKTGKPIATVEAALNTYKFPVTVGACSIEVLEEVGLCISDFDDYDKEVHSELGTRCNSKMLRSIYQQYKKHGMQAGLFELMEASDYCTMLADPNYEHIEDDFVDGAMLSELEKMYGSCVRRYLNLLGFPVTKRAGKQTLADISFIVGRRNRVHNFTPEEQEHINLFNQGLRRLL